MKIHNPRVHSSTLCTYSTPFPTLAPTTNDADPVYANKTIQSGVVESSWRWRKLTRLSSIPRYPAGDFGINSQSM